MTNKPPLGLKPRWLHEKQRVKEICDAMERYAQARMPVPVEWITELKDLLKISHGEVTE